MESHKVSRTVLVLTCLASSLWAFEIELYSEKDRRGQSIKIDVSDNDCSELPLAWQNGAASVDTIGNCVQFYDEPKCKGSLTVIQPFHIIHQMDLSLINYAFRLRTASPCGPKLKGGRYIIQNSLDASVMAALNKHGNFAKIFTVNTTKSAAIPKSQQWEILEKTNSEYNLKPRENSDNYPVSFDEDSLKKGVIKRKTWKIMSVGRGRYIIKDSASQRCLYKTDDHKVEEHSCRIWSTNQEWVFRPILGDTPSDKPKAQVGDGINFNILSKVATVRPPTKPPPQFYPINFNVTKLAEIQKYSTAAPYRIKKKIKRGPRPKNKYVDEPSLDLKPPGLRPAIPKHVSSNNNFLLFKPSNGVAQDSYLPEFVPSDDSDLLPTKEMIKSTPQYKQYMEIVKQYLAEQRKKNLQNQSNKGLDEEDYEDGTEAEEEEDEDELTTAEDDDNTSDESVSEATAESQQKSTEKPKKGKGTQKHASSTTSSGLAGSEQDEIKIEQDSSDQPGFMSQVFNKFKSNFAAMVPSVPKFELPSISNVLPTLPSVPVPKLTLSFTKAGGSSASSNSNTKHSNTKKTSNNNNNNNKSKTMFNSNGNGGGSTNGNSGYTFSYSSNVGKNGEKQYSEHPKFTFPRRPTRFFLRSSSTTTKKPLTVGSWGIFG